MYIGESQAGLNQRIGQYYSHVVGWKGPHTGGYWIKLINELNQLYVYYSEADNSREAEFKLLMHFIESVAEQSFYDIDNLSKYLPFGNLKVDFTKYHLITNAVKR